jgi:hypothetical protein
MYFDEGQTEQLSWKGIAVTCMQNKSNTNLSLALAVLTEILRGFYQYCYMCEVSLVQ